jgi:hypothetical protein
MLPGSWAGGGRRTRLAEGGPPGAAERYIFDDRSMDHALGDGKLFVASRPETVGAMWPFEGLRIPATDDGRLGELVMAFRHDAQDKLKALTLGTPGPLATAGHPHRTVPAE